MNKNDGLTIAFLLLVLLSCRSSDEVQTMRAVESDHDITFRDKADRPILSFVTSPTLPDSLPEFYTRDGFIHPLYSPKGIPLTADYPAGHHHQHGIFHAWTRATVKGDTIDFWNQHSQLGTVRLKNHARVELGNQLSLLDATMEYLVLRDGATEKVAEEDWTIKVFDLKQEYHLIDLEIDHRVLIDSLIVQEYHYGGMGFRGNETWNLHPSESTPYDSLLFIKTNDGLDHTNANHTRPEWITMWGLIEADTVGYAVFPHPNNFRHPQPVRVHPTMPYFSFSPMVLGNFTLEPEDSYRSRFRIATFDGSPNWKELERIRTDYK